MDALAPTISEKTMELHYGKHHQTYVDKANEFWIKAKEAQLKNFTEYADLHQLYEFNYGGHVNHEFYWESLTPEATQPSNRLA